MSSSNISSPTTAQQNSSIGTGTNILPEELLIPPSTLLSNNSSNNSSTTTLNSTTQNVNPNEASNSSTISTTGTPDNSNNQIYTPLEYTGESQGGYDYELLGATDSRYECPICLLYLRDPVLTTCGHRFCSCCISCWFMGENGGKCPVDGQNLSHENIFPDNYTRREIMQSKARCPYAKDGCKIVLILSELERHIQNDHTIPSTNSSSTSSGTIPKLVNGSPSTSTTMVDCHYKEMGCAQVFPRDQLQRHLESDMHLHLQLVTAAFKRLKIFSSRSNLEHSPQSDLFRQDSRESTQWLLAPDDDSDDYWDKVRRQRSWDSVRHARKYHLKPSRYQDRLAESDESLCKSEQSNPQAHSYSHQIPPHLSKGSTSRHHSGNGDSSTENQTIREIFERMVRLEQNDREKQIKIDRLESRLSSAINLFSSGVRLMDDLTARYCHGVYVWKIPGFRKLCLEMRKNPNKVLNSPGFYTSSFGYKLCLRFNLTSPNSSIRGSSTHLVPLEQDEETFLSLYIHFMQGEFDESLAWPFQGELDLSIIHPISLDESISDIMESKPEAAAFTKPTLPRNPKGFGYPEFCPINKIFCSGYVKHDTLTFKVLAKSKY